MKLLMINEGPQGRFGVRLDDQVLDLVHAASQLGHDTDLPRSVITMIQVGQPALDKVAAVVAAAQNQ